MKEERDNFVTDKHDKYDDFFLTQYIVNLDIGDKVQIKILDKDGIELGFKEFIAKQVNCHINCTWQDKGVNKIN